MEPRERGLEAVDGESRLAPGWRLLGFVLLFFLFSIAGQLLVALLPPHPLGWATLVATTLAALAASWVLLVWVDRRPPGALGFALNRAAAPESGAGFLVGGGLNAAAGLLLLITGSVHFLPDAGTAAGYLGTLAWTLAFFTIAAALEELLFRGYPFQVLVEWIGVWPAVLVSSALFSWLHGQNPNITALAFGNIFLAGVLLALAYLRTRSLWFATALHLGWNWVMASLLDFPVSGLTEFETPLYTAQPVGPQWWTGGDFGPEAGLAGTLALLGGCLWIWSTPRLRPAPETQALGPVVDRRLQPVHG
jgi:uncharacterized protein